MRAVVLVTTLMGAVVGIAMSAIIFVLWLGGHVSYPTYPLYSLVSMVLAVICGLVFLRMTGKLQQTT